MFKGLFNKVAALPFRHNYIVLIVIALLTVLALVEVAKLKFEWDQSSGFPQDLPTVQDYKKYSEIYGSHNYLLVTVETIKSENIVHYDKFIEKLFDALTASPLIKRAMFVLPESQMRKLKNFAMKHLFLYLTPADRAQVVLRYSPRGIRESLSQTRSKRGGIFYRGFSLHPIDFLLDPFSTFSNARDPLGINSLATEYFKPPGLKFKKRQLDDFYTSSDGRMAFFLIDPVEPFWNLPANEPLVKEMQNVINRTTVDYKREHKSLLDNIRVSFAGWHTLWLENFEMQKRDMLMTVVVTAVGVFFIFLIGFKSVRFLVYAFLPLSISIIWTLGLASALFGSLNIYTFVFTIMIMGLGVDFAIHMLNSYRSAAMEVSTQEDAWQKALKACGSAVLCGATTTIVAFGLLVLSDFSAIWRLGLLVAAGLIFVLVNVFMFMPAIMRFGKFERLVSTAAIKPKVLKSKVSAIVRMSLTHSKKITIAAVILTAGICFYVFPLTFNPESTEDVSKKSPSAAVLERLTDKIGVYPQYMIAVSMGRTFPEVLETSYALYNDLKKLQAEGYIAQFDSPSRFLPPYDVQRKNLKILKNTPTLNHATFRKNYIHELDLRGIKSGYLRDMYFPVASNILLPKNIVTLEKIKSMSFSDMFKRYLHKEGDAYDLITYIFYSSKAYDHASQNQALSKLSELSLVKEGKVKLVGSPVFWRELRGLLARNIKLIFVSVALAILGILFVYFRSVKASLLALMPVFFSVVAMLGVFKLLGYTLNVFNSMWIAIILGIGIDDGVHLISRYQATRVDPSEALGEVGRAIIMTTLTTLVAFGSMTLAKFSGFRSSGVLAASGMIFALIASLVILPALMKLFLGSTQRRS